MGDAKRADADRCISRVLVHGTSLCSTHAFCTHGLFRLHLG